MRKRECLDDPAWSENPATYGRSLRGNREVSRSANCSMGWSASGRRGAVADDERTREVRLRHSSEEACEQRREAGCEWVEPRAGTKRNTGQSHTCRAQNRASVSQGLDCVRQAARQRKKERFTALLHHVTIDRLRASFFALKRNAAPGVDGLTPWYYEAGLEDHLQRLHARVHSGAYRALPVRRQYIPKPDGKQRPLGIAALEDKIVQRAVVEVLNAIYEGTLGFSYGFRPGRSQHDALDALATAITGTPVNWILDTDLKSFDSVSQEWLVRFIEHRIGDQRIIRLVRKWLKAGVLEDGELSVSETGTPQGSVASPLFANVYLHYVFDLWANRWRRREAKGNVIILRYADDVVVGFEHEATHGASGMRCVRGWRSSRLRFTRQDEAAGVWSLCSGKSPTPRSWSAGDLRLLGFIFICGRSRRGAFQLQRKTRGDRMRAKLRGSRRNYGGVCMNRSQCKGNGLGRWCAATSRTTRYRRTRAHLARSVTTSWISGDGRFDAVARRIT